ncbi:hypothetical protein FHR48_000217 [Xanthomonas arboricola]|nr:hypothetical protein [Xanthomonas cannabis]NIK62721.1 hypothetical protein [Xanthomonas cannabis]
MPDYLARFLNHGQSKFTAQACIIPVVMVIAAFHVDHQSVDQLPIVQRFSAGQEHEFCDSHASLGLFPSMTFSCFCSLALNRQELPRLQLSQSFGGPLDSLVVVGRLCHCFSPLRAYESTKENARVKFW